MDHLPEIRGMRVSMSSLLMTTGFLTLCLPWVEAQDAKKIDEIAALGSERSPPN